MEKDQLRALATMLACVVVMVIVFSLGAIIGSDVEYERFDECLDVMGEIGIDANDTLARSEFMKTCNEVK